MSEEKVEEYQDRKRTALLEMFKKALKDGDVSAIEMQWSIKSDDARWAALMAGAPPTTEEENVMLWFVMKQKGKIPAIMTARGSDGNDYQIKVDKIDPLV